eukprot:TRINITY_DN3574_c0_g3_i1.p1 TRINITY_DN3574_c0_g3~~TRINITY_DN3574_c0_g3_i1.p1  ORF type:complete len:219 (+),score=30.91 TRINITY_DN3574_c0_g3_i1:168-824(+)
MVVEDQHSNTHTRATTDDSSSAPYETQLLTSHFLILFLWIALLLGAFLFLIHWRYRRRKLELARIPRDVMPFLRPGDLSHRQRAVILNELVRTKGIQVDPVFEGSSLPENTGAIGHFGWGPPTTEYSKVHFKTSIAKSYLILERAAMHRDKSLERPPTMSIRDYVHFLEQNCPDLNKNLCSFYIDTYETARFSDKEFSMSEYTNFMAKFFVLIQAFER